MRTGHCLARHHAHLPGGNLVMKLFAKTLLTWKEPLFFVQRMYTRRDWMWKAALVLGMAACMLFGFYADRQWGKGPARKWGLFQAVGMSLGIGVFLGSLPEWARVRRDVTLKDDAVGIFGQAGFMTTAASLRWR